jgi:hypothetical protein
VGGKCTDIRYKCQNLKCDDERRENTSLIKYDLALLSKIEKHKILEWYPKNKFYYKNGMPFKEKQKYESIDELFTKRNLYALAILMEAIEGEENKNIRDFFKIAFTSMVHLCTRMNPVRPTRPMSSAWTQQSYWFANEFMEQNVWEKFESAILGKQSLLKAKEESNQYFKDIRFATSFKQVLEGEADIFIYTGSCLDLMQQMEKKYGDKGCIDYIFTDPPYDSSIQYGELTYMWVAWMKKDEGYLEKIVGDEIIHNERQGKDFEVYHSLLKNSFEKMFNILKPDSYLTVTFHNPTFKVRNATIRAGVLSGFELQKVHHQELARPSAKSLLQPFGSAQGDFYLRFHKPDLGEKSYEPEAIDALRFEKIVLDTTIRILAERGEPTPYTIIINAIDPELVKRGFFSELDSGLDVKTVLEKKIDKDFVLVDAKMGDTAGKLWWFKNPSSVAHLEKIPLSERVEKTVLAKLQQRGKVTFTDIWEAVSIAFPNSLTSDQTSIKEALEVYANPIQEGFWLIKPNFQKDKVEKEHSTIIAILAEIGQQNGFDIYIGKNEQNHTVSSDYVEKSGKLGQYLSYKNVYKLKNMRNPDVVDDIDVLWIKDDKIEYLFEVECTTSMTSALERGSNVEPLVKKVMLFPNDREIQYKRKMKSPMFKERYISDNWNFILFNSLLSTRFPTKKKKVNIEELFNVSTIKNQNNQLSLF